MASGSSLASADDHGIELVASHVELDALRTLLCDADDNLFPSEQAAYAASVGVVNRLLEAIGAPQRYEAEELRHSRTGKNFRTVAAELLREHGTGLSDAELDRWVAEEKRAVSEHLSRLLTPDREVVEVLNRLSLRYELAAVSSSALSRIDVCLTVTGLAELLPPERRFSAEDSLPRPTSKPDPAVYRAAAERLHLTTDEGLAIEDSPTGVRSAVAAGFPAVGNVQFVADQERDDRVRELVGAGAFAVVSSWRGLEALLTQPSSAAGLT